ncbi:M15 family metallopeptidase [Bifidobacterium scardovii]|uniref:D-alanyl-D-alanine carboxypeptidase n=1 Tax=Bifidobacterium scardovii TaxID=158787 RepID=A0A087DHP9_9BIFI|nr:M15 family metallopeptidase [Bifidobacterium scardovii]KFI95049.1 D-alanyl-D-alanine carboxypeptidase [Bifidobacterium scardovii]
MARVITSDSIPVTTPCVRTAAMRPPASDSAPHAPSEAARRSMGAVRGSREARGTVAGDGASAGSHGGTRSFQSVRRKRLAKALLGRFAGWGPFAPGTPQASYAADRWNLIIVNRWNRIPDDYPAPELTELGNGQRVDSRIYPDLQRMFDAMRADGLDPEVSAGYRTRAEQQQLMNDKVIVYRNEGMSKQEAEDKASQWVAIPGTSEHEIGLAVDVNAAGASDADANQRVYDWLASNAWRYGFILRYPDGKTDFTGNAYEAWHYRYVAPTPRKPCTNPANASRNT